MGIEIRNFIFYDDSFVEVMLWTGEEKETITCRHVWIGTHPKQANDTYWWVIDGGEAKVRNFFALHVIAYKKPWDNSGYNEVSLRCSESLYAFTCVLLRLGSRIPGKSMELSVHVIKGLGSSFYKLQICNWEAPQMLWLLHYVPSINNSNDSVGASLSWPL